MHSVHSRQCLNYEVMLRRNASANLEINTLKEIKYKYPHYISINMRAD